MNLGIKSLLTGMLLLLAGAGYTLVCPWRIEGAGQSLAGSGAEGCLWQAQQLALSRRISLLYVIEARQMPTLQGLGTSCSAPDAVPPASWPRCSSTRMRGMAASIYCAASLRWRPPRHLCQRPGEPLRPIKVAVDIRQNLDAQGSPTGGASSCRSRGPPSRRC